MTGPRSTGRAPVGVMDVGGSHVTAAVIDPADLGATVPVRTADIDPHASCDALLDQLAAPARAVADGAPLAGWLVAMPGPFDSSAGRGTFAGVDKFAALAGVDLRGALAARLDVAPALVRFCNDAVAYGIGEWAAGAGAGVGRMVCITLGTGVGSAFLADGVEVDAGPTVPANGEVHRLTIAGRPLERTMSSPALRDAHRDRTGQERSVEEICARARAGDAVAGAVVDTALEALGAAVGPWVDRFGADAVVVGGSIARSWDVVGPPLRRGLASVGVTGPLVVPATLGARAPLVGAAVRWEQDAAGR